MGLQDLLEGIFGELEKQRAQQQQQRGTQPAKPRGPQPRPPESEPEGIGRVMRSVVQVVALKQGFLGGMSSAWTGSGSIVDPSGIILTNCHVANPRAMGMSAPEADRLGIAITERSDDPPAITYFAELVVHSPELDLAVLRIVGDVQGRGIRELDLPAVRLGDSDTISLGDQVAIFGYPGIGGETVTFTSGNVSGFSREGDIHRGWIKTDATIAGGNSGGTAVTLDGLLIGVPTQAAAGSGITPVDARPVLDTNRDGRVDERDTPMAIGGFINGLRPINLAIPLLERAGMNIQQSRSTTRQTGTVSPGRAAESPTGPKSPSGSSRPGPRPSSSMPPVKPTEGSPKFTELLFSTRITTDGRPVNPTSQVPAGIDTIHATFEHRNLQPGTPWSVVWMSNGEVIIEQQDNWDESPNGRKMVKVSNRRGLPEGEYHLVLGIGGTVALEGKVIVGTPVDETDSEVSGQLVDSQSGKGVADAVVIVLQPQASLHDFMRTRNQGLVFTSTTTAADGRFTFPKQLPKGQAYSLVAAGQGYEPVAVEGALRVGPGAPEQADIGVLEMEPM